MIGFPPVYIHIKLRLQSYPIKIGKDLPPTKTVDGDNGAEFERAAVVFPKSSSSILCHNGIELYEDRGENMTEENCC